MTDPLMSQWTNGGRCGYSSAGLTWPRRVRPNSLSFRPLRSTNPSQSPEGNMDSSQSFLSPSVQQRSGYVSPLKAVGALKEYEQRIDGLRSENFKLKLNLYFLERAVEKTKNPQEFGALKTNVDLNIEVETLKIELMKKANMLHETMIELENLKEKHELELQHSRETQMQLEGKIEALKEELEKEKMQTPRSSDAGSEIYRQAFGIEDSLSGKSSPEYEVSWEQRRSQYLSELEKLQCTIDEKDKEIKNMRTAIEDLRQNNTSLEKKLKRSYMAIQGLVQSIKKNEKSDNVEEPQGSLQKSLMRDIEVAHNKNSDSVVSNDDIRKGLNEILSTPGSSVKLMSSEDSEQLRREILRKDEVIQALQEQLTEQTRRARSLEESASGGSSSAEGVKGPSISKSAIVEQECARLQKAVRDKDRFIQELLDERTKLTSEHEKTVKSFMSHLQNQGEDHSGKIKDSDIYDSESMKMFQELICEKDAEIDVRKKSIEMLNFQLTKCQSELQNAIASNKEKDCKLLALSRRSMDLQSELTEIQHEMQMLKAKHQNTERSSDLFETDQNDDTSRSRTSKEISKPLIDLDDSLKSNIVPEKRHASLTEIKELQRSIEESRPVNMSDDEDMEFHGQHSSSQSIKADNHLPPNLPSVSDVLSPCLSAQQQSSVCSKGISERLSVRTPRNEIIRLSLNVNRKITDVEKSDLLDIMESNIEEFEQQKLRQQLEDCNIELAKLGRKATLQEDMASVLAEDKKRMQQELEEKTSEVQMLSVECSDLGKQVITLQNQLHSAVKRADELERIIHDNKNKPKTPVPKSSAAAQTDSKKLLTQDSGCNTDLSDLKSDLATFGQSDSVNALKEEMCILTLMVEEKDKEILLHKQSINKLKSELKNMIVQSSNTSQFFSDYGESVSVVHQQLNKSQNTNNQLYQHLQEVARFLESLLSNGEEQELNMSSLKPEDVSRVMEYINESIELSGNLSQNLTICEESKLFDADEYSRVLNESLGYPQSELFKSGRISLETIEDFRTSSRTIESEGSEHLVVPHHQNADLAGKSWKLTSIVQHKPAMDVCVETVDSDQLTILGASSSEEGKCSLDEQNTPDLPFREEFQAVTKTEKCVNVRVRPSAEEEMRKRYLGHVFDDAMQFECDLRPQRLCWYAQDKGGNGLQSCFCYTNKIDSVLPLRIYQKCSGVPHCNISSDSDIWSEPDRNLSLQRIGIDLETPSFHTRSPPKKRRSSRDKQFSDDCSSDNSFSINGIPRGRSHCRRRKSIGSFRREATEPKLDVLMESHRLALERSIEDKLTYAQRLSETVQDGLTEFADKNPNQAHALVNLSEEINSIQSTLSKAVKEVKIWKDTMQGGSQLPQDHSHTQEPKPYSDEVLNKIDDTNELKEMLAKEHRIRASAERDLYSCQKELLSVKQELNEAMLKMQEKRLLEHDEKLIPKKDTQGLRLEAGWETPYTDEVLSKRDYINQLKEILAKERLVRASAERDLYSCQQELLSVKQELSKAMLKKQEKSLFEHDEKLVPKKDIQGLELDSGPETPYTDEVLNEIDDTKQLKEMLAKERRIRTSAERDLYSCQRELLSVKQELSEALLKMQDKSLLKHDEKLVPKKDILGLGPEAGRETSERETTSANIDQLKRSLAQEEERNVFLSKQMNDILNESKKLKIESEELRFQLMNEQRNLEELRQQLRSEQDMVKQLNKEKNASESKSVDLSADMMRMRASHTELQDQNKTLNKQVHDLLSENKKIKLKVEESEIQLNSEREQLENLNMKHLHKQESLGQLAKDRVVAENKMANLTTEVKTLKIAISQKDDQIASLNMQINDLSNENWKVKKEMQQLEMRLRTEVKHVESIRKVKDDLHQQNMDLTTEKGELEKRLYHSEERLKVLTGEKTDLSKQIFEKQRASKDLIDKIKLLEDQKVLLEKEINKYKSEIHSSDSVSGEARYELKQTKEKLKKLELELRQYESELSKVRSSNEHLLSEKKSLSDELESLTTRLAELSRQNGETKKLLKEKTNSYNETEREKLSLVDQIENLRVKKVQAESSRDKLISEYDSLAMKVDSLERRLKDSDLSLQKNKDEQDHLRQQATSLQNKIKLKESVIKDLEEQHDVLHEQLKDLQHSLNKNDIDLKHLEEENHSLEMQILALQKQLKKTSSHLEVKDSEISQLQENIFCLEQKVKDKEAAQKRALDEKKASEDQMHYLEQQVKKQESFHKQLKEQAQELEQQVSGLELQLQSKELLRKRSEDDAKTLQGKVEEKEKSIKKLDSALKKMEHKLSVFQDANSQLQQKVKLSETSRRFSEDQTAVFRDELNRLRETMLMKARKEEPASTDRLSTVIDQLNSKDEYCKALENKVIEYQKQILNLQREHDRVAPVAQLRETSTESTESIPIIPSKVFSEPRSSQDYRIHTESKAQGEKGNLIKGLELDNSDLKHQIEVLNKKFDIAEKAKRELEEENLSLWKTLYGSVDEKTDIIKTLEMKNSDLKNQVVDLEEKLESSVKLQQELEEEKNSLWKTLYGKQDDQTDVIRRLEQKNKEFRDQLEDFQSKLRDAEKSKQNLREEKDTLWKTIHGKKDEKTEVLRDLQLKNNDFKGQIEDLKMKVDASEKTKCDLEEEKNSLWKALYGQKDEKADVTKLLKEKNKEMKVKIEVLEKELSHCEKAKSDIEEKKNTLWKTLYGSQDEKTEAMKKMEEKNNDLRGQIAILEKKLVDADSTRAELEEEKNSMWKTLCGSEDEKTDLLQQMEAKNVDLKDEIEILKKKLISADEARKEMEEEKSSLWKTLYGSEHEKGDIIRSLEVKNNDLKGQVHILERKLEASEKVKKDLEERINSLRVTLYGREDEKTDAIKSIELKNSDLLTQVEVLKKEVSDLEKERNELEEEKTSLWKTLCGHEDERSDVLRRMEQKNNDLSDQIQVLEKKLSASEKILKEVENEKTSLWKTLYGSEHEQSDMIRRLEQKNKDLSDQNEELKKKLCDSEKAQTNLEEEKHSLWMALHGSDDEKTHEIRSLETKTGDLKGQVEVLERKLSACEKMKNDFEEEKNTLWKNMYGSQDEKAASIKKLNMEIGDCKSLIQNLENKLSASEKAKNDLETEKSSLSEKLSKSIEENASITNKLELKDSDLKNQMKVFEEKLKVSEDLKKTIEEERNSLYKQLLGEDSEAKFEGMLKETQIYVDQVKKLEQDVAEKTALLSDMKGKLFASENSLTAQQNAVEQLNKVIFSYKMQLEKAYAEREWFQNQYIDSQREVIRATQPAATPGREIREEDMVVVHQENADLKKQVTELLSQLHEKDTPLSLPPVKTELFAIKLPTLPDDKAESSADRRLSSEMKRAELEKMHIEKNYLQKVVADLKKQMESQLPQKPDHDVEPGKLTIQKQVSDFSEDIAKQLEYHGLPSTAVIEELKQVQNERDHFKNLVDKLKTEIRLYASSLRDKSPGTFSEAENAKLRKENADLRGKLVQLHARLKKRESLVRALSNKIVELSQSLKDSRVTSTKELSEAEKDDSLSILAAQIVEESSKTAERSLSEDIVMPDIGSLPLEYKDNSQLLSLLHPSLRLSIPTESGTLDLDEKGVQKLMYKIEELENHLEDTKMDNYRLQEEVNTLLLKFGIQNNQLVCEKCGKSADIVSAQPSAGAKPVPKFASFRKYLEKDLIYSKEESINKLSECKWKLQNEVLNMQRKLCVDKPSYLENQQNFNDHIAKIVSMEYPKIPVKIFSEPLLLASEGKDIVKNAERFELLWKNQVLHLERDIKCLQNCRMFLEQFVSGMVKELTEAAKEKPTVVRQVADTTAQKPQIPETGISGSAVTENGIPPQVVSSQQLLKDLPAHRRSMAIEKIPSVPTLPNERIKVPAQNGHVESSAEVIVLQNKIKELNKKIEGLQSENKKLKAENKLLSTEYKKSYRNKLKEIEKQAEDLKSSLRDANKINQSMQLELDMYHQMLEADPFGDRPAAIEKHLDGYVSKRELMEALRKIKRTNAELVKLAEENRMLRKRVKELSSASKGVKPMVLPREESSSDKESEGTVTLSPSESLSSLESMYRDEVPAKKYKAVSKQYPGGPKRFQEPWDLPDLHGDHEDMPFATAQRRDVSESIQETFQRSHFSSPDLGIESDPNHELLLSEPVESDEKSYVKARPPRQPVTPTRVKSRKPSSDTVTSLWDSVKMATAVGSSLHAVGPLKEYIILTKEIDESLALIKGITVTAKGCIEHLSRGINPNKNLGYATLKDVLRKLSDVDICQVKAQQLVRSFWVSSVHATEDNYIDVATLLQENQELRKNLEMAVEERNKQKLELEQAFVRLREAQESKEKMEKAITKQLFRTKKVLRSAKTNLQESEQRPGAASNIPQKKNNNPSSVNKPSTK